MDRLPLLHPLLALCHTLLFALAIPLALRIDLTLLGLRSLRESHPAALWRQHTRLLGLLCASGCLLLPWSYAAAQSLTPLAAAKFSVVAMLTLVCLGQRYTALPQLFRRRPGYVHAALGIALAASSLGSWLFAAFLGVLDAGDKDWSYGELMTAYLAWLLFALYGSAAWLRPRLIAGARLNCPQEQ